MIRFEAAQAEQYDQFMQLMHEEAREYLQSTLELMQISQKQFDHLFRTLGEVHGVYEDQRLAGFYWIEQRERVLHLHALILKLQHQSKGMGSQVLEVLSSRYRGMVDSIELGVHDSNERAIRMYERHGFKTLKHLCDLNFRVMQKQL